MIRKTIFSSAFIFILVSSSVSAPIATSISISREALTGDGQPLSSANTVNVSYVFDYIFKRDLENNSAQIESLTGNFIRIAYPWKKNISFYGLLGMLQYELEEREPVTRSFETSQDFAYGGGVLIPLFTTARNMSIDADLKYRRAKNDVEYMSTSSASGSATFEDWQAALIVSRPYEQVTPYIGVKYSDIDISGVSGFSEQGGDYLLGTFAGVKFDDMEEVFFSIEARFIDEFALSAQLGYQF